MDSSAEATDDPAREPAAFDARPPHRNLATALIAGGVLVVLAAQIWSAYGVVKRATELRGILSDSYATANRLERRIGYGGLIHHFKNYVLRPDEDGYRGAALSDAVNAVALVERLRDGAASIGVDARLEHTREMIESYAARLEQVRELSVSGRDPQFIDERVRFDDEPALREVQTVLTRLDDVVDERLATLQRQGALTSTLSTVGTAALGALFIGVVVRRQRRHVGAISALAERLRSSNEGLIRANTSLSQFAGIVSHDLKTPLRHIDLFSGLIVEDADDAGAIDRYTDNIHRSVRQMEAIIESLLDFTKTGFSQPQLETVDVRSLFSEVERDLRAEIERNGARLELDVDAAETVEVDPALMARVFSNLIGNSLKYARRDEPARIVVRAEHDGEQVVFSVTDNGIGIEPRFAERIFEPLERLHGPDERYEGVGIGLSLVRSIVEGHGGRIWLDTAHGNGARIAFSLPRARGAAPRAAA